MQTKNFEFLNTINAKYTCFDFKDDTLIGRKMIYSTTQQIEIKKLKPAALILDQQTTSKMNVRKSEHHLKVENLGSLSLR